MEEQRQMETETPPGENPEEGGRLLAVRYSCERRIDSVRVPEAVDLVAADAVVLETAAGEMMGEIIHSCRSCTCHDAGGGTEPEAQADNPLRFLRVATAQDRENFQQNQTFVQESRIFCKERISARNLPMKLVAVETTLDRNKTIFYFTAEGRVDFRELIKDLVQRLRMRIELRQINSRNEARILGGIGSCGKEICCTNIGANLDRVSIKMAKEQNVAINPEKISGLCGRLMCCLAYEYETYVSLRAAFPRLGQMVQTGQGTGKVIAHNVVTNSVNVVIDGEVVTVPLDAINEKTAEREK